MGTPGITAPAGPEVSPLQLEVAFLREEVERLSRVACTALEERDAARANFTKAQEARDDLWCENRRLAEKVTEHLEKIAQLERVLG